MDSTVLIICSTPDPATQYDCSVLSNQFALVVFCRTFCGALFFPTIATFLGSTLFEEVKIFPFFEEIVVYPHTVFFWREVKVIYFLNAQYVTPSLKIGSLAGAVTAETRCDGWILLCRSQGSAENLPQAEPVHTAVQAPDS